VGGRLIGDNYPSAEILVLMRNHTIVHRYSDIVSGLGIWSFVEKPGGKATLLVFDHLDAHDNDQDRDLITFYWKGLVENLAAVCEGREMPFDHDARDYKQGMRPTHWARLNSRLSYENIEIRNIEKATTIRNQTS